MILTPTTVVVLEGFRFVGFPIFVDEVVVVRICRHVLLESRTGGRRIGGKASDRREGVGSEGKIDRVTLSGKIEPFILAKMRSE